MYSEPTDSLIAFDLDVFLSSFYDYRLKGFKMRDMNILMSYKRLIDMKEKIVKNKKKYSRKIKHKNKLY